LRHTGPQAQAADQPQQDNQQAKLPAHLLPHAESFHRWHTRLLFSVKISWLAGVPGIASDYPLLAIPTQRKPQAPLLFQIALLLPNLSPHARIIVCTHQSFLTTPISHVIIESRQDQRCG
jgi:hypothetical protein